MYNELFHIGSFTVYGYGLMIAIGVIAAVTVTEIRLRRAGLEYEFVYSLTIWAVVGGFLGAKLLYILTIMPEVVKDPAKLIDLTGGYVVYGGIIGGVLAGFIFSRVKKLGFWLYMDYVMPSIILAQAFGRIGCFLAGCCYGAQTQSAFSVTFTNSAYAPNGVALYPTQLVSSAYDFLCFFLLVWMKNKRIVKREGNVAAWYFLLYGIGRFIIEFFRGDERGSIGMVSTSQFISIFIVAAGLLILLTGKFRPVSIAPVKKDTELQSGGANEENKL